MSRPVPTATASFPVTPAPGAPVVASGAWSEAVDPRTRCVRRRLRCLVRGGRSRTRRVRGRPDSPSTELEPVPAGEALVVGEMVTDALDQEPDGPVEVVLALGANLGPAQDTLREAVDRRWPRTPGIEVRRRLAARAHRRGRRARAAGLPQRGRPGADDARPRASCCGHAGDRAARTGGSARSAGARARWTSTSCVYGSVLAVTDDLELPHPRAHERAFVLEPWAQVDPDAVLPGLGGGTGRRAGRDRARPRRASAGSRSTGSPPPSRRSAATTGAVRPGDGPEAQDT